MTWFIPVGFLVLPPLLWAACVISLSGDRCYIRIRKDGALARWTVGNKVAAIILLVGQAAFIGQKFGAFKS